MARPTTEFDEEARARLQAWLAARIDGFSGDLTIEKFPSGQSNPTYRIRGMERDVVLRRKPPGKLLPRAHLIEREYRIQEALADSGVPVPRMLAFCDDESLLGTSFYIMNFIEGRMFDDPLLPLLSRRQRSIVFSDANATIARLHGLDQVALGLADYGRPEGFMKRQIETWTKQYRAAQTHDIPAMDALIAWLPQHLPAEAEAAIFHGDLRLDNMIFHPSESSVVALIDWELSTVGDPWFDLAYHTHIWHFPRELMNGMAGADLPALGIPSAHDYLDAYCERVRRRPPADWTFYLSAAIFRIAAILQGIAKRAVQGNASAEDAAELGARTAPVAGLAWRIAQGAV